MPTSKLVDASLGLKYIVVDLSRVDAKVLNLNTAETEWLELFTGMASAKDAPKTKDPVIADVYSRLAVNALEKNFITEIATGMVTEAEISTRIGTARREGREEANLSAAEALLRDNDTVERVSRVLKLPLEKVQELADKIAAEKAQR
ncbi:MAG: hypothetical protein MJY85_08865 [Fibrobacter sp.]|nr:hypothetical protein [Fibrobacter sp.]